MKNNSFNNKTFNIKIYINNIKYSIIILIGAISSIFMLYASYIENDKNMKIVLYTLILFCLYGIILLSIILIKSTILKIPSFVLDERGLYYNNLIVKNYIDVMWVDIKELKLSGGYLFIYLKSPQTYYNRKFRGRIISEDPLYIYLPDLNINNTFINNLFKYFKENYNNIVLEQEKTIEELEKEEILKYYKD